MDPSEPSEPDPSPPGRALEDLVDVTITAGSPDWLADHARRLVEQRLAACGNIVSDVRSIYRWEGVVEDDTEALVVLHTRRSLVARIVEVTNDVHPDDVVQILATPVVEADPAYHQWVLDSTG